MGGDEFLIAFSRTGTEAVESVWQRILKKIDEVNQKENRPYIISVSHGVVTCEKEHTCATTDRLIKEADKRMYEEKSEMKRGFHSVKNSDS
jgi:diguanylate cyclase (GGDEF)-like protein